MEAAGLAMLEWIIPEDRVTWSENLGTIFGFAPGAFQPNYEWFLGRVHPDDRDRVRLTLDLAITQCMDHTIEFRIIRPDGGVRWLVAKARMFPGPGGPAVRMIGVSMDVTERKEAEEEMRKAQDELEARVKERTAALLEANRALQIEVAERRKAEQELRRSEEACLELLRRIVTAQEEERQRISRELHDQVGQALTALLLGLKSLEALEGRDEKGARASITCLQDLATRLGQEVHHLALELRPAALDDLGLHTTMLQYVEEWSERSKVQVDLHSAGIEGQRYPSAVETAVYRIVQEALNNVLKHARAQRVSLIFERRQDDLLVIVEDDGCGFDADNRSADPERRLGLLGMKERTAIVGGTLEIESSPGHGTTLIARIPVDSRKEH